MAITLVASTSFIVEPSTGPDTSPTIDTSGAALLEVTLISGNGAAGSLSDSKGNAWHDAGVQGGTVQVKKFYAYCYHSGRNGTGHAFTIGAATDQFGVCIVRAYSGTNVTFDEAATNSSSSATSISAGSVTPPVNGALITTAIALNGLFSNLAISGESLAIVVEQAFQSGINFGAGCAEQIQTTAAAINPSWSWTTTRGVAAITAAYYEAGSPPEEPDDGSTSVRLTQQFVEVLRQGATADVRLTQQFVEVLRQGATADVRLTQQFVEVMVGTGGLTASVDDVKSIIENVLALITQVRVSSGRSEAVGVTDTVAAQIAIGPAERADVNDVATVTDAVSAAVSSAAGNTESIALTDQIRAILTPLLVRAAEVVSVLDTDIGSPTKPKNPNAGPNKLRVKVQDIVTVSEGAVNHTGAGVGNNPPSGDAGIGPEPSPVAINLNDYWTVGI